MKYTIEQKTDGENEVIVRYSTFTSEIEQIVEILKNEKRRLIGTVDGEKILIELSKILYIESVDGKSFAYTDCDVIQLEYTLMQLEQIIREISFFRCSKSMIINIDRVRSLRSLSSNRIDATMSNGEHVMISRTYASDFRKRLREGVSYE